MLENNMKILATLFFVTLSALASMTGVINILAFNRYESAPIIMLLLGVTLIGIAATVRRRV